MPRAKVTPAPYPCRICGRSLQPTGRPGRRPETCAACGNLARTIGRLREHLAAAAPTLGTAARNRLRAELRSLANATLNTYHPRKPRQASQEGAPDV